MLENNAQNSDSSILALDPGIERTGYAILKGTFGSEIQLVDYGCITTKKNLLLEQRFLQIYTTLMEFITRYKPRALILEQLFFNKNQKTVISVSQSQGVMLLAAAQTSIPIFFLTPLQIKMSLTGYGKAEKLQVQKMVQTLLKLETMPKPDDTVDAIACGLAFLFTNQSLL
ncbi:crossover junction endodeoxyribonuclease RuvC [Candidatus Roizmanbacteria bacterium CG10_big_fil_rev_8_21_14_0_10_39_6]|uniref:Crossover junction endodeoxyribonuclease RuvC n=1 Tax=Candidatus Roizmanbacteria bacterium CG10_big_fil_rev_8_21_14_0_10_39_6 TaxID=1974853 RepID=A0A2M8KSL7_9BACT|nr:MAG: crossover junction endodeoxyribonuclease RuvC [Candidatus Roizmanbacteria bacterium CG10_big_fil_rev_8_21_14_0_10_39_6]